MGDVWAAMIVPEPDLACATCFILTVWETACYQSAASDVTLEGGETVILARGHAVAEQRQSISAQRRTALWGAISLEGPICFHRPSYPARNQGIGS